MNKYYIKILLLIFIFSLFIILFKKKKKKKKLENFVKLTFKKGVIIIIYF